MSALITLTQDEIKRCDQIAEEITALKSSDHRIDRTQSDLLTCKQGVYSECAAAKWFEVPMNTKAHYGGDAGHDLIWKDMQVQVKYNTHMNGSFYVRDLTMMTAHLGILVVSPSLTADPLKMKLVGWLTHKMFHDLKREEQYLTKVYSVKQHQLMDLTTPEDLWEDLGRGAQERYPLDNPS